MKATTEFEKAIQKYLESVKNSYPELSAAVLQEGKNIQDCCNYIIQEVKKKKVTAMTNEEVFSLANDYYLSKENIKPKPANCKVVVTDGSGAPIAPKVIKEKKPKAKASEVPTGQLSMFDL